MTHLFFKGHVWHNRYCEVEHSFSYPLFMVALELTSWDTVPSFPPLFGLNKRALLSLRDIDLMHERDDQPPHSSLVARLNAFVLRQNGNLNADSIILLTTPRLCGYAFNPVNFYLFSRNGIIEQILCEVHNTFGQTHRYLAPRLDDSRSPSSSHFTFPKEFCVSPFLGRSGSYHVTTSREQQNLTITVELFQDDKIAFAAGITGTLCPLTSTSLIGGLITAPGTGWLSMTRITSHALVLLRRGVTAFPLLPLRAPSHTSRTRSLSEKLRLRSLSLLTRGRFREVQEEQEPLN